MRGTEGALRGSRVAAPIGVVMVSLYISIYITVSERGYGLALVVLLLASVLLAWSGRRRGGLRHP